MLTIFSDQTFFELLHRSPSPAKAIGDFVPDSELSPTSGRYTDKEGAISALMPSTEGQLGAPYFGMPRERFVFGFIRQGVNNVWVEVSLTAFSVKAGDVGNEYIFASLRTSNPNKRFPYSNESKPDYDGFAVVITDRDGRVLQSASSYQEHWGGKMMFDPRLFPPPRA